MKLQQGQAWKYGDHFIRLVVLERKSVRFKLLTDLTSTTGPHQEVSKKEFCRLVKKAVLLSHEESLTVLPGKPLTETKTLS